MSTRRIAVLAGALLVAGVGVGLATAGGSDPDPGHEKGRSGWIEVADRP